MKYKIGQGIDCHQLIDNIPFIIGGTIIDYNKGSKGYSDGDVLYHALSDALLGSMGRGDIGSYFPSSNSKWKNANSSIFVKHACKFILEAGFSINNIDATIVLQKPSINKYIEQMKNNISKLINVNIENISIKATTTDNLGFIGNQQGICAFVTLLISQDN